MQALVAFLDEAADGAIRALWRTLHEGGVPGGVRRFPPHVVFGAGTVIPTRARSAVREELTLLALPRLWLATLAIVPSPENALVLAAIVDTELLAVHSAVHDALAGKVRQPAGRHLPGSWLPHCVLAERITPAQLTTGCALLHPVAPVHATLGPIAVLDTTTGEVEPVQPYGSSQTVEEISRRRQHPVR